MTKNNVSITARGVILHEGKMLLVRHPHNEFYCLPGGTLEYNEDIRDCIKRELLEELGTEAEVGRLLYVNSFILENKVHCVDFIFEILNSEKYLNLENKERTHSFELAEIVWIDRGEDIEFLPPQIKKDFDNNELLSDTVRFIK